MTCNLINHLFGYFIIYYYICWNSCCHELAWLALTFMTKIGSNTSMIRSDTHFHQKVNSWLKCNYFKLINVSKESDQSTYTLEQKFRTKKSFQMHLLLRNCYRDEKTEWNSKVKSHYWRAGWMNKWANEVKSEWQRE